jgi:hypothetical protein
VLVADSETGGVSAMLVLKWGVAALEMQVTGRGPLDAYI